MYEVYLFLCPLLISQLFVTGTDTTKELELSTCLDYYLDNVIANVPELALALHSKVPPTTSRGTPKLLLASLGLVRCSVETRWGRFWGLLSDSSMNIERLLKDP